MIVTASYREKNEPVNGPAGDIVYSFKKQGKEVFNFDLYKLSVTVELESQLPLNYACHQFDYQAKDIKALFVGELLYESTYLEKRIHELIQSEAYKKNNVSDFIELNGAWLLFIVDNRENKLLLLRDPIGLFSLYYTQTEHAVLFSSSLLKIRDLSKNKELNADAITAFLHFLYIPAPETIYSNLKALQPGSVIIYKEGHLVAVPSSVNRYLERKETDLPDINKEAIVQYLADFELILQQSLEKRIKGQHNTGIFLSGGKDSSAIAIAASKIDPGIFTCINIGFEDQLYDESNDAAEVARTLGLKFLNFKFSEKEYHEGLNEFIARQEQPFLDISGLPVLMASKLLDSQFNLYLDGTGNDYYIGIKPSKKQKAAVIMNQYLPFLNQLRQHLSHDMPKRLLSLIPEYPGIFKSWQGWEIHEANLLLQSNYKLKNSEFYKLADSIKGKSPKYIKTLLIAQIWEPHCAFQKAYKNIFYSENAVSYPFTDVELVSFFNKNPIDLSHTKSQNKVLIREYIARHLPPSIINKKKGSFIFDTFNFLKFDKNRLIHEFLSKEKLQELGIENMQNVQSLIERFNSGHKEDSRKLLALVVLSQWFQTVHKNTA